jgi:hypothetical protein
MINQAYNVLTYTGYKIIDDKIEITSPVNESTHVISYYVLKASNFNNIDKFLEYLYKYKYNLINNVEYINLLKININLLIKNFKGNKKEINSLKMTNLDINKLILFK